MFRMCAVRLTIAYKTVLYQILSQISHFKCPWIVNWRVKWLSIVSIPAISQLRQYSSLTNTSMTQYRIKSGSKWESTEEAIHSSRTAFHLTAGR